MAVAKMAGNFDRATNPNPTDFANEILIRQMRILAGSVTSLVIIAAFNYSFILIISLIARFVQFYILCGQRHNIYVCSFICAFMFSK